MVQTEIQTINMFDFLLLNWWDCMLQTVGWTLYCDSLSTTDEITCCKQKSKPWIVDSLSLNWLHVASGTLNLEFVTPSPSFDKITCCKRKSKPWICDSFSLNWLSDTLFVWCFVCLHFYGSILSSDAMSVCISTAASFRRMLGLCACLRPYPFVCCNACQHF